jgi:hypothetical protein
MVAPVEASLVELDRLGRIACTYARVIGRATGPNVYSGCPSA